MNLEFFMPSFFFFFKSFLGLLHLMRWSARSQHHVAKSNLSFLLRRFENLEGTRQGIIHAHHCTSIVKLATVIRCGKYGYQLPLCKKLVSIFHNLIIQKQQTGDANRRKDILVAEIFSGIKQFANKRFLFQTA
jgi:hypothetical protein